MSMNDTGSVPTLQFTPQRKYPLTESEWCAAWDDYFAVYIQKHPQHITDLITYSRHIKELMTSGANWRHYDQQFRSDREYSQCSWAAVRVDLQLSAMLKPPQSQSFRNHQPPQHFRNNRPFRNQMSRQLANSYCFTYQPATASRTTHRMPDVQSTTVRTSTPARNAANPIQPSNNANNNSNHRHTTSLPTAINVQS